MKTLATYESFAALDIRVGRILRVEDAQTKKPTYRITVDFGPDIGTKVSCGAFRNYAPEFLVGKQVVDVVNFGAKRMGPEVSEALILGVPGANDETILLMPQQDVALGVEVF